MGRNWVRRRTIMGGLALGGVLAAVLVLAGVLHVRVAGDGRPAADASPSARLGPLTATQPELEDALLAGDDLPESYRPAPATRDAGRTERCRTLFERPWEVTDQPAIDSAVAGFAGQYPDALLRQALALFAHDGAARAVGDMRRASRACPEFDARLEDGTAVRVQLRQMGVRRVGDETYAVRLTTRGESGTRHGYLAVGRIGPVLSVLRQLGSARAVDPDHVAATLSRALRKAAPLAAPFAAPFAPPVAPPFVAPERNLTERGWDGAGKMEPCRLCGSLSPR